MAFRSSIETRRALCPRSGVLALVLLGLLLSLLLSACPAAAGPREDADAALRRGVELRREGKDADALEMFQRALSLSPSPRARAQVALAEQALSLWTAAERDLAMALAAQDDPWIRQNREALEGAARVVASKLAWVVVDANVPDPEVYMNGAPTSVGDAGRVRVVAGLVTIEARAAGHERASRTLHIAPESTTTVKLVLDAVAPSNVATSRDEPSPTPNDTSGQTQRAAGWILTGVGAVAIGGGAIFGLRAIAKKDERDADCVGGCSQIGVDADRAGRTAGLVSTLAIVGGVAAAGAGLWFVLSAPSSGAATRVGVRTSGTALYVAGTF